MNSLPQIQSVSKCRTISNKEASDMLTKFLLSYKKFGETGIVANTDDAPTDEYIDKLLGMEEDQSGIGTHEEIQARLEGIIRSLNGIKKPMAKTVPTIPQEPSSNEESATSPIKVKDESIEAKTPSETKEEKKLRKKQEKEAKKSAKKAKKEAKKKRKAEEKESSKSKKIKTEE